MLRNIRCDTCEKVKREDDFRRTNVRCRHWECLRCEEYKKYRHRLTRKQFEERKCARCDKHLRKFLVVGGKTYCQRCKEKLERKKRDDRLQANYERHLEKKYGLSIEQYRKMLKHCGVCGSKHRLGIDHNHETNKVRGILCRSCNSALGFLREDPDVVRKMLRYIEKHL